MSGSVISVRLEPVQKQRLDELAATTGRSASYYLREALNAHLDDLEYVYQLQAEAEAARRGKLPTVSLDDLETQCDLAD
ncbi:ribbon-helix-helix protein, CopG family [Corynebacterium bovis]|uniref:type II toxin-antitoxin system RelB family antitoxin n=1 Tax=Corynebacterium bovis TaxID=36808 RepID=UPI000F654783|nr:ribbon-helix-helix protein, CopG family [Corynebacterium bovis]RRO84427.1 peptidylprolyl isomerase [Corynebacterium bovis]RRO85295.1 peptidylprolyl isomerase [Corynebacterium bovis]